MLRYTHRLEHVVRVPLDPARPFSPSWHVAVCRCGRTFEDATYTGARSLHAAHLELVHELSALRGAR